MRCGFNTGIAVAPYGHSLYRPTTTGTAHTTTRPLDSTTGLLPALDIHPSLRTSLPWGCDSLGGGLGFSVGGLATSNGTPQRPHSTKKDDTLDRIDPARLNLLMGSLAVDGGNGGEAVPNSATEVSAVNWMYVYGLHHTTHLPSIWTDALLSSPSFLRLP